ncbi:hypothetical protein BX600DRAFT_467000 [Xylariales sp. PMI_506]|nr:hypothetical protein BX600DRAFT_467000 [Xylariales sp. PMI_506]
MADLYKNLDYSSTHIRLLRLLPSQVKFGQPWYECADIRCSLIVEKVDSAPAYDALSYAWGDDDPTVPITINGEKTLVRPNLAYALAALRGTSSRLLWIDALCINQDNVSERNHQVRLMGDIYRRASKVLVWLGRSGPRTDFLSSNAVTMLERFGAAQPVSSLPPPPPDADVAQEFQFEQWIEALRASYKLEEKAERGRWTTDWSPQLYSWALMKEDRAWMRSRRECVPHLISELTDSKSFSAGLQIKLQDLQTQRAAQHKVLVELQSLDYQYQQAMNAPTFRLLQKFQARQTQVFQEAGFVFVEEKKRKRSAADTTDEKVAGVKTTEDLPIDSSPVDQLYNRINNNLGAFQRYVVDERKKLEKMQWARSGGQERDPQLDREWKRIEAWKRVDVDERRALNDLREQIQGWLYLENKQTHTLLKQRFAQDEDLKHFVATWDAAREGVLRSFGSWRLSEEEQRRRLKRRISGYVHTLKSMTELHEREWVKYPALDTKIDPFLTEEELQNLARLKENSRRLHQQFLAIRMTEVRAREPEMLLRQDNKWRQRVYNLVSGMRSVEAETQQMHLRLIQAQTSWVRQWNRMRTLECKQWQGQIFNPKADEPSLSEMFFGLIDFCNLPYWSRLWIVQEVLLAKKLLLCFGDDARTTRGWDLLSRARSCLDRIPTLWNLDSSMAEPIKTIQNSLSYQLDRLREGYGKGWPLHKLVEITEGTLCRDPRDKVYGLLGLAKDCHPGDIVIDYKKPAQDVFLDTIRWYHQKHGSDDSYPSVVRLSKSMQRSFIPHGSMQQYMRDTDLVSIENPSNVIGTLPSLPNETFCVKGAIKGQVLGLERLLDDSVLMVLRQRDWIGLITDYLDSTGVHKLRTCIEKELIHLSSIKTSFAMKPSTAAYGTCEGAIPGSDMVSSTGSSNPASADLDCTRDEQQFFMLGNGQFGVASTRIREGDLLCEFEDLQTALILRHITGGRFALVSRAVLSQSPDLSLLPSRAATIEGSKEDAAAVVQPSVQAQDSQTRQAVAHVHLDAASLQQLTQPYEMSAKHTFRDQSYLHEADFGWYEFATFGIDTGAAAEGASAGAGEKIAKSVPPPVAVAVPETSATDDAVMLDAPPHSPFLQTPKTPATPAVVGFKEPLLMEVPEMFLPPQPLVFDWPQIEKPGLLFGLGSNITLDVWSGAAY